MLSSWRAPRESQLAVDVLLLGRGDRPHAALDRVLLRCGGHRFAKVGGNRNGDVDVLLALGVAGCSGIRALPFQEALVAGRGARSHHQRCAPALTLDEHLVGLAIGSATVQKARQGEARSVAAASSGRSPIAAKALRTG